MLLQGEGNMPFCPVTAVTGYAEVGNYPLGNEGEEGRGDRYEEKLFPLLPEEGNGGLQAWTACTDYNGRASLLEIAAFIKEEREPYSVLYPSFCKETSRCKNIPAFYNRCPYFFPAVF